jgi:crotonobetainyl-CoA:carnitine CoA-transferase CaiB-like acyl-CoA transferase
MADVLTDQQMRANGIVVETGDEGEGYELTIASPINVREAPKKRPSRAPDVGADSVEVLRDLGFAESYVAQLVSSKVILTAESES